jgi:PX domain
LHEILTQRWPAINIPRLPPKKAIGRYEVKFLQERRYFLERFLRKCGNYDYIVNSEEFLIFARPNGDVEKVLQRLGKLPCSSINERLHISLNINEKRYDIAEKEELSTKIAEMMGFSNRALFMLKEIKTKLKTYKEIKTQGIMHYKQLFKILEAYEGENVLCYEEGVSDKRVLTEAKKSDATLSAMEGVKNNLQNPFEWMYYWCKGEIYDLKSLVAAGLERDLIDKQVKKAISKKRDAKEDLGNMQDGKTTLRTVFKNAGDTTSMKVHIEATERDIENLGVLYSIVTVHLG